MYSTVFIVSGSFISEVMKKVRPDWRDNPQLMRTLGYDLKSRR